MEIRLKLALQHKLEIARENWARCGGRGMEPTIVLLTLTQRHSGDLAADQAELARGWRRLYKSMHAHTSIRGERWGKFPFVRVWEVTPGRCTTCDGYLDDLPKRGFRRSKHEHWSFSDEHKARNPCTCEAPTPEGHVHMHVACVWTYRDWGVIAKLWGKACPSSEFISIVAKRDDGKPSSPGSVTRYLGKYLSKGVDVDTFTPELRADVSAAFYNVHSADASTGFWLPDNHECRKCTRRIKRVVAVDAWIFDTIAANGGDTYHLLRRATLAEQLPSIVQRVWHSALGPAPPFN